MTRAGDPVREVAFRPLRDNERLQTMIRNASDDRALIDRIARFTASYGTRLDGGEEQAIVRTTRA